MFGKNMLDIVTIIIALGAATAINRSSVKKQTISDLRDLVEVLQVELEAKDRRICHLEEIINANPELVRERNLVGCHGQDSGNSSAHSKTTKNRGS